MSALTEYQERIKELYAERKAIVSKEGYKESQQMRIEVRAIEFQIGRLEQLVKEKS